MEIYFSTPRKKCWGIIKHEKRSTRLSTSRLEKIRRLSDHSAAFLTLQKDRTRYPATPFCVSCWVNLDSKANENLYVGAWNISQGHDEAEQWCGLWLKAPKSTDWGGTSSTRGITFFMTYNGNQPNTNKSAIDRDNVYEFFNADGTEATLTVGETYHILFEFVPGTDTPGVSPAYIRIFVNGTKLYGKHALYADQDSANSGVAYSACPVGASSSWGGNITYGGGHEEYGFNRLNNLEIGKSNAKSSTVKDGQWFYGAMDEFSMWHGTLTSDDVTRMNYYCQPSNLIEEYANVEIKGTTGSWEAEFGATAPYIGTDVSINYTGSIPTASFDFGATAYALDLFQLV